MTKKYYSEYVRHALRFYARNTNETHFNNKVDKNNWYACHKAIAPYSDRDKDLILRVFHMHDTLADNVYEVAKLYCIDQNIIWDLLKDDERSVAQNRGLI